MQYPRFILPCVALLSACPGLDEPLEDGTVDGSVPAAEEADDAGAPPGQAIELPDEPPGVMREIVLFDRMRLSSQETDEHFRRAETALDFGAGPFAAVSLHVDLESTCFPFSRWTDEEIPDGQVFPASCDAVDRNFEISFDEPRSVGEPPGVEVMRAITPFGGPMSLDIDLTDFANARPGEHRLQALIDTWADVSGMTSGMRGGWTVSARVNITTGAPPANVLAVIPLFNASLGDPTFAFTAPFVLPAGTEQVRLELRTTGHGAGTDPSCFGPSEEYCQRVHTLDIDGQPLDRFDILRSDCACTLVREGDREYCAENPLGPPESVRSPRAGWCPGTLTPPRVWTLPASGGAYEHSLRYAVDHIAPAGHIRASAVVYALGR